MKEHSVLIHYNRRGECSFNCVTAFSQQELNVYLINRVRGKNWVNDLWHELKSFGQGLGAGAGQHTLHSLQQLYTYISFSTIL